jgi:hypothetical protein
MNTAPHIDRARATHHKALEALARQCGGASRHTGLQLWRKLRTIEQQASNLAAASCNGDITDEQWQSVKAHIQDRVITVLGGLPPGFFVNGDPRGYALKLEPGSVPFPLHEDRGRYQLLAPVIE